MLIKFLSAYSVLATTHTALPTFFTISIYEVRVVKSHSEVNKNIQKCIYKFYWDQSL